MNSPHSDTVGVIGSGLGGLAAACTLAARGYQVTLIERNEYTGGKAAQLRQMMDHFTQYVGSSPYGSPAVLCGIAHMQTAEGISRLESPV